MLWSLPACRYDNAMRGMRTRMLLLLPPVEPATRMGDEAGSPSGLDAQCVWMVTTDVTAGELVLGYLERTIPNLHFVYVGAWIRFRGVVWCFFAWAHV